MSANVKIEDFSLKVMDALDDAAVQWLEEAVVELEAQATRNSDFSRNLHGTWKHVVNESKMEATVGNPMQLALWMEMGTGEYALKKNGRKGYWVYVKGNTSVKEANPGKARTLEEARQAVAILREQGLDAHYTKGQKPRRMLHNAFETKKAAIIKRAERIFKGRLK